jgi:uncharacterized membrane protein YraQ (UPF0718 family)
MRIWPALRGIIADRVFIIVAIVALATGITLYEIKGADAVAEALRDDLRVFTVFVVFLPAVLMLASIVEVMLPKSVVERWLGVGSGFKGIAVASFAGAFTPGGPFLAFPMVLALYRAGADWAPLITYITSWSILSMPRLLVFEIPFVGGELASVRYLSTLILPPIAGLLARYITRIYRPPEGLRD